MITDGEALEKLVPSLIKLSKNELQQQRLKKTWPARIAKCRYYYCAWEFWRVKKIKVDTPWDQNY